MDQSRTVLHPVYTVHKKQAQTVLFLLIITKLVENTPTVSTTNLLEVN